MPGPDYAELDDGRAARTFGYGRPAIETRPFVATSEFVATAAALAALAITAASSDALDAGLAWPLATGIVAAYVFGRGFAKAGTADRTWDPRELIGRARPTHFDGKEDGHRMSTVGQDYETQRGGAVIDPRYGGLGRGMAMGQAFPVETKPFFLTSEFWACLALIAGLAIAAGTSEQIDARLFWMLATAITIGYVISRGIAKSGTKSRAWDPRDDLMQGMRERMGSNG